MAPFAGYPVSNLGIAPLMSDPSGISASTDDGGSSPEEMVARWKELGGWPLTLSIRAFNRFDFRTYEGGTANHAAADAQALADVFAEVAAHVPGDAPYPLLVRMQILRVGQEARGAAPFLSHECIAETADDLRAALISAGERARERFV
jgi:hypothetical protein